MRLDSRCRDTFDASNLIQAPEKLTKIIVVQQIDPITTQSTRNKLGGEFSNRRTECRCGSMGHSNASYVFGLWLSTHDILRFEKTVE